MAILGAVVLITFLFLSGDDTDQNNTNICILSSCTTVTKDAKENDMINTTDNMENK